MSGSSTVAADLPTLLALNGTFQRHSTDVSMLVSNLTREIDAALWKGKTANEFRAQWSGQFAPMLQQLVRSLELAGQDVRGSANRIAGADGQYV